MPALWDPPNLLRVVYQAWKRPYLETRLSPPPAARRNRLLHSQWGRHLACSQGPKCLPLTPSLHAFPSIESFRCVVCRGVNKNFGDVWNNHVNTTVLSCVTPCSLVDIYNNRIASPYCFTYSPLCWRQTAYSSLHTWLYTYSHSIPRTTGFTEQSRVEVWASFWNHNIYDSRMILEQSRLYKQV
jgi:hypothetical protein